MGTIQPEEYDEYGEIVKREKPTVYERKLTTLDKHRIHETKDLFEGDCPLCVDAINKRYKSFWQDDV